MPMQDPDALAALLAEDISTRRPLRDPGEDGPADLDDAYDVQARVVGRLAPDLGGIGGRKIAWNSPAQLEALGLEEPGAACICRDLIVDSPARLEAPDYLTFAIEPEIAAVLSASLAPQYGGHDRASVAAAVERFIPAFELLDPRTAGKVPPMAFLVNNINNRGVVVGGPGVRPSELDHAALRSVVTLNGEVALDKEAAAPMDPLEAVAFLANRFNALGHTLEAGEILLLGAHMPVTPVQTPATMRFELGVLGSVEFEIA